MGKFFRLLSLLSPFVALFAGARVYAADPDLPRYNSTVSEVRLAFSALDRNGHAVATLQQNDFAVVDRDLVVRKWRSFGRTEYTRLEIVIAVDASASISTQLRDEIDRALVLLNASQGMPEESFSILSFGGHDPLLVCSGRCRSQQSKLEFPTHSEGLTPLFDNLVFASDFLRHRAPSQTKRVLLLLSDGEDTVSRAAFSDALDSLRSNEVQLYALDTSGPNSSGSSVLQKLAKETGGRYLQLQETDAALSAVLEDFRATYVVTYELPSRASGYHQVHILPTRDVNLSFRSASGYYYPASR